MRKVITTFLLAVGACFAPASARALNDTDIYGDWLYRENGSIVRIYACGNTICGRVIRVKDRNRRDVHNPNAKLRNRPIVGIVIASKAKKAGKTSWRGNLYNIPRLIDHPKKSVA